MKKIIAILLAGLMCLCTVGCNENQEEVTPTTTQTKNSTTPTTTTENTITTTQTETTSSTYTTIQPTTLPTVSNAKYKVGKYPEYYYAKPLFADSNFGVKKFDEKVFTRKSHKGYYFSKSKEGVAINEYSGNKKSIVLPEKVDGKKVVRLAGYFDYEPDAYFYEPTWNIRYITKVETMATEITLSRYIKYIEGAFGDVEKINVVPENEYYSSQDGALYSKDKKILYFVPPKMRNGFKIPESVEMVHFNAFSDTSKNIMISKNVKHFDSDFKSVIVDEENPYLSSIEGSLYNKNATELIRVSGAKTYIMPESVEFVNCKNSFYTRSAFYGESGLDKVVLGKNLKSISPSAYHYLYYIKNYRVDKENKYFSAKNGVLYNYDKTQVYLISYDYNSDKYKVPETVEKINLERVYHSLENIHIGKNVKDISLNDDETGIWIKIYCYENSYAHKFAKENGIEFQIK